MNKGLSYVIKEPVNISVYRLLTLAGEEGFEPPFTVLETAALPLYYSPMYLTIIANELYYNTSIIYLASKIYNILKKI